MDPSVASVWSPTPRDRRVCPPRDYPLNRWTTTVTPWDNMGAIITLRGAGGLLDRPSDLCARHASATRPFTVRIHLSCERVVDRLAAAGSRVRCLTSAG